MKILELTRSFYPSIGGMEKFVADRLKIYENLNIDYQVITTTHSEKKITSQKLNDVIYLHSYTPYEIVPALSKVMKHGYDLLSLNQLSYYYSVQAVNSAYKNKKKIILTPHFHFHTDKFKVVKKFHNIFFVPQILTKVNKIICFTEHEANYWIKKYPAIENKIVIIPHYFEPPEITGDNSKNDFGKFFLFLGRGEKNKRFDLLIQAFSKLNTDYHLVLTLDEDEIIGELKNLIKKNERIHILGRVSEKRKQNLLATCSALILPTDFEAFGIVNFEASYYRKPLLITELPVFNHILDKKGVIYFENNLNSIINALKKFIRLNEKERKEMGDVNFRILENYSFDKIVSMYKKMLAETLHLENNF